MICLLPQPKKAVTFAALIMHIRVVSLCINTHTFLKADEESTLDVPGLKMNVFIIVLSPCKAGTGIKNTNK